MLQLPDGVGWSTMEHSVAVIDPGQDQTARQCLCKVRRQQVSNVTVGLCVEVAWPILDNLGFEEADLCILGSYRG